MATQIKDLTRYKHVTINGVTVWYDTSSVPATLVAIRLFYKKWTFFPADGSVAIDGVGSEQVRDGSINKVDLAEPVQQSLDKADSALQPADVAKLTRKVAALESLISDDDNPTAAIDKFNEIVAFLSNITNTETMEGIIADIGLSVAAKYAKPAGGIPRTDLAQDVQTSLSAADAISFEKQTDPVTLLS